MQKKTKQNLLHRLKITEGQMRGIQKMIESDAYCIDIITQTSAIRHALSAIEDIILKQHLSTCVVDQIKSGNHKKAVEEILSVYNQKTRK